MSKYRCPVCGASHKDQVTKCRLCGQDMTSPNAVPLTTAGARAASEPKKGIAVVAFIGIGVVLLIAAAALFFGLTSDDEKVEAITKEIPGVVQVENGWVTVTDTAGGFTASLPPEATEAQGSLPFSTEPATVWTSLIGKETVLTISYVDVDIPEGQTNRFILEEAGNTWSKQWGRENPDSLGETGVGGYPAAQVTTHGLTLNGEIATAKALLVLKGGRIYVIQSVSAYQDHPSFEDLANGFAFTPAT